jgi:uncharacterized protein YoxC
MLPTGKVSVILQFFFISPQQLLQNASDALNKADRLREDIKSKEDEIEGLKVTGDVK